MVALVAAACALTVAPSYAARSPQARPADRPHAVHVSAPGADCRIPVMPAAQGRRVRRAHDGQDYTLRQLRRIDRNLQRALGRTTGPARSSARFGLSLRIPVHVHVINGRHSYGPSRRQVDRQLTILNRAYDGAQSRRNTRTRFRFYLASLDRTRNQRWYHASFFDAADRSARRHLHRGGLDALNLYIAAPRANDAGGAVLGYSSVPWVGHRRPRLDGVTIHRGSLRGRRFAQYNRGDTAVHEVGHWLGLFHTFEGGCTRRNDRVADTPAQARPSYGCPVGADTCARRWGRDPVHNFMDYSVDACMNRFTPGQVGRMMDNWLAYRTP